MRRFYYLTSLSLTFPLHYLERLDLAGANPNVVSASKKDTPLILSIQQDNEKLFDLLIRCGADPNLIIGENQNISALHFAASHNKYAFARKLLALSVDPNISSDDLEGLWTPLHEASLHATDEMIGLLLDAGANIECKTSATSTALALAARHYKMSACRYLLKRGANVNTQDKSGSTPLMQACLVGATSVAQLLIEVGKADVSIKNHAGATALDEADRKDMWECALYVWSAGCESGALKTAKGLGPVKWIRPRIMGHLNYHTSSQPGDEIDDREIEVADGDDRSEQTATTATTTNTSNSGLALPSSSSVQESNTPSGTKGAHFSSPPAPRYGCATAGIGNTVYLFGGVGYPDGHARYNPDAAFHDESLPEEERLELFTHTGFYRLNMDNLNYRSLLPSNVRKVAAKSFKMSSEKKAETIKVEADGLTVTCTDDSDDAAPASVFAATSFRKNDGFSYFEVEIINAGTRGISAVGLVASLDYATDKMPGWDEGSIGYHADDACAFHNTGWGRQWGKRYSHGDVVGCGILWETGEIFYTLNGEFLGVAYRSPLVEQYYAAVGFRNPGAHLKVNFGVIPFVFDFRAPSIQWERLPSSSQEFEGRYPFYMFAVGGGKDKIAKDTTLVLLGNGQSTAQRKYWIWHQEKWFSCHADGEQPFVFGNFSYAALGDSIYVLIKSGNAQLNNIYPKQPLLFRLKFKKESEKDIDLSTLYEKSKDGEKEEKEETSATNAEETASVSQATDASKAELPYERISPFDSTWQQIFPKPASFTVHQDLLDNWFNAMNVIEKEFSTATLVGVEGKLCFVSKTALALLDPETFEIEVKVFEGAIPPVDNYSAVVVGHHIETFGGWDAHSQRNEVNILDTRSASWYPPHVIGISPRPRNHHFAVAAKVSSAKHLRKMGTFDAPVEQPRTDEDFSSTCIVHAYGWNGCNYIDDVEVLSLQNKEESNSLIQLLKPIERPNEPGIVNFKVISFDGTVNWLSTSAIVIAARASKWREQIIANGSSAITIEVSNTHWGFFSTFIKFLHDDLADFDVDRDGARLFCKIVETYAPEHSKRVVEALVLTRLNIRSRMADDMAWAFENALHADISIQIFDEATGLQKISAHKSILMARSQYFQSLLSGGLVESTADSITISDAEYQPFRMVLQYLYTQALDMGGVADCITEVFILACKYAITDLKLQLESIIAYNLSVENAVSLLLLADSYQAEGLKKTCAKFVASHYEEVLSTEDYEPNAEIVFAFIQPYLGKKEVE